MGTADFVFACQRMFPNTNDTPAFGTQHAVHQPVAGLVACELLPPERPVASRYPAMTWTRVPEASVNEHRETQLGENEIRFAKDGLMPTPGRDAMCAEHPHQCQFRVLVSP